MPESLKTRLMRFGFNLFPAYRGMGARVLYVADDLREIRCKVRRSLRTRNYVGTIYGGSMYGMVDPVYMVMLIRLLGPDYVVWDKAATIRFRRPGTRTLYATFRIDEAETDRIRRELEHRPSIDCVYRVDLVDADGTVYAEVEKTIYVAKKDARMAGRRAANPRNGSVTAN